MDLNQQLQNRSQMHQKITNRSRFVWMLLTRTIALNTVIFIIKLLFRVQRCCMKYTLICYSVGQSLKPAAMGGVICIYLVITFGFIKRPPQSFAQLS